MEMQNKLTQYVELFENVRSKVRDDTVAMALVEQVGKDLRVEQMRGHSAVEQNSNESQPATEKQIGFLKKLRVSVNPSDNLTKAEASRMIDQAQEEQAAR